MTGRDPVVARALAELAVPDHAPGFWDRLDAALAAARPELRLPTGRVVGGDGRGPDASVDAPVDGAAVVADVVSLHGARRTRPDRRGPMRAVAVAAVLAAVVGGVALAARDDGGGPDDVAPATEAFAPPSEAPPTTMPAPPTTAAAGSGVDAAAEGAPGAAAAAVAFVDALAAGDVAGAAALVGEGSSGYAASFDGGLDRYLDEQVAVWRPWVGAVPSVVELGPGEAVAVFESADGAPMALPVVRLESAGRWIAEPFAFDPTTGGRLQPPLSPADDGDGVRRVGPAEPLVLPAAEPIAVAVPGGEPETLVGVASARGPVATWVAPEGLEGPTTLVVARRDPDGTTFVAEALRLEVVR